ncbi:hypothetical protein ACEN8I_04695 [Polaromonas sp. CT11-55]|uniref:hypothetical protein n=1 Tax=Polaromonas sp. CT11-55 TaxID=3243045 RepID=UPI0039A5317C
MIRKLLSLAVLTAATAVFPAHAETVKVGRASIELPEGNWKALTNSDSQNPVNGINTGALPVETRTFVLVSDGRPMAILKVNSSKGGGLRINWTNTCTSNSLSHAINLTQDPNALECIQASVPVVAEPYLKRTMPDVLTALESNGLVVPSAMQTISAAVGSSSGTSLSVNLVVVPSFIGLQGEEASTLPARLKPGQVAWARQLATAVKGSVYSMSGNMTLPPVAFATPRVTSSTPQ